MNILVINWQDIRNPLGGGAEVHLHQVFTRIAAMGNTVTVLCSSIPGFPAEEDLDGLHIVRRGSRSLFNFAVPRAYRELRQSRQFDVVVDDMNKIPFMAERYVDEPVCGIVHHLFGASVFHEVDPVSALYVSLMEARALRRYRRDHVPFIAVSPSTRDDMIRRGYPNDLLRLVSLAVDHTFFQSSGAPKSPEPLIGYVGRVKRYKSIDHVIDALPAIRAQVPSVRLIIVGEGDDRKRLEQLVRARDLHEAVEFTGYVSETRKVDLLQAMWALVMPSSKEGWGLTVTEANACGTPAIVSDVPGLRDAVVDGETGLLFRYGDRVALAERVIRLLTNAPMRTALRERAIEFSRRFSWDVAARETLEVLQSVAR